MDILFTILVQKLTKKDLLFSHRIRSTHYKSARVERYQFESCTGCKIDGFLLCGERVLRAAVTRTDKKNAISNVCTVQPILRGHKEALTWCLGRESAHGS